MPHTHWGNARSGLLRPLACFNTSADFSGEIE